MSILCSFCDTYFLTKSHLNRHQTSAKYCLEEQKKKGVKTKEEIFKCDCGDIFYLKHNFSRHQKTCSRIIENKTIINTDNSVVDNSVNITNSFNTVNNITVQAFSMTDLTPEVIYNTLKPVITNQIANQGMGALTDMIVEVLLQRDGKYIYYCTDASRKTFKMLVNHEGQLIEKKDPNALCIRSILVHPLSNIIGDMARTDERKSIQSLYEEVKNLKTDGKTCTLALASSLPSNTEGIPEEMRDLLENHKAYAIKQEGENTKKEKSIVQARQQKLAERLAKWLDGSVQYKPDHTLYYQLDDHYCFRLHSSEKKDAIIKWKGVFLDRIELLGYANTSDGKIFDFGEKELKAIKNLDFTSYLADKYKSS